MDCIQRSLYTKHTKLHLLSTFLLYEVAILWVIDYFTQNSWQSQLTTAGQCCLKSVSQYNFEAQTAMRCQGIFIFFMKVNVITSEGAELWYCTAYCHSSQGNCVTTWLGNDKYGADRYVYLYLSKEMLPVAEYGSHQ